MNLINQIMQAQRVNPQMINNARAIMQNANSPEMQTIRQMLSTGANPRDLVIQECQRQGLDFNAFMNSLK